MIRNSPFAIAHRRMLLVPWAICMLLTVAVFIHPVLPVEIPGARRLVRGIMFYYDRHSPVSEVEPITIGVWGRQGWLSRSVPADVTAWIYAVLFVVTLAMLLAPGPHWLARVSAQRRPNWVTVLGAAVMCGLLTSGVLATVLQVLNLWEPHLNVRWQVSSNDLKTWVATATLCSPAIFAALWVLLLGAWCKRGTRFEQLHRLTLSLAVVSLLFIAFSFVVQVLQGPPSWWAAHLVGSYTGLIFGGTVLLWAWTARHVLLFAYRGYERYLREHGLPLCDKCGYDLRGTIAAGRSECPECGWVIAVNGTT